MHFAIRRHEKERKMGLLQWPPQENRSYSRECTSSNCSYKPNLLAKVPNIIASHFCLCPGLCTLAPGAIPFCCTGSDFSGKSVIYAPNKSSLKLLLKEITSPLKWVFNHAQLFVQTLQPHRTFARGPWCFPNSLLSQLALECDSMLFPFQLKGSWGYKGIWLIGQNPVKFAEKQVTAKGEGCGGGECVNRGAQDQPKSLLKSPSPAHTVVRG